MRELTQRVVVGARLRERDRYEVQSRIRRHLRKKLDRPSDHADQRRELARFELLQRGGIVGENLLDLDAQALEDDGPGQARCASRRPEADLLALEVLEL